VRSEVTQLLLKELIPHSSDLGWRRLRTGNVALGAHNLGGRIFIVKDGTFEVVASGVGTKIVHGVATKPRWQFFPGELFGELELPENDSGHEWLYSASVVVQSEGSLQHAEVLEIPCKVVRRLMKSGALLGNPFLTLLRRKVLEGLIRFDDRSISDKSDKKLLQEKGWISENRRRNDNSVKPSGSLVMIVATLVAQGLEVERQHEATVCDRLHVVLISDMITAVTKMKGRGVESTVVNSAIRFLASAGVLRRARAVVSESKTLATDGEKLDIDSRIEASRRLTKAVNEAAWTKKLAHDQQVVLKKTMTQQTNFFVVDDEFALRRFVLEPGIPQFESLATREYLFRRQAPAVESARGEDLERAIVDSLKRRFEGNRWQVDSLGWPMEKPPS
jgi:hypothetical protein